MNHQNAFIEVLRQNWSHLRQQETLRMWIGNVFIAIVVATAAYLGKAVSEGQQIPVFVPIVILMVSLICLGVTLKANKVFVETKKSIINIFQDKKIDLGVDDWRKYVGMLESRSRFYKILRIRYLYVFLYGIVIATSIAWLCILIKAS